MFSARPPHSHKAVADEPEILRLISTLIELPTCHANVCAELTPRGFSLVALVEASSQFQYHEVEDWGKSNTEHITQSLHMKNWSYQTNDFVHQLQLRHQVLVGVDSVVKLDQELLRFQRHVWKDFCLDSISYWFADRQVLATTCKIAFIGNAHGLCPEQVGWTTYYIYIASKSKTHLGHWDTSLQEHWMIVMKAYAHKLHKLEKHCYTGEDHVSPRKALVWPDWTGLQKVSAFNLNIITCERMNMW